MRIRNLADEAVSPAETFVNAVVAQADRSDTLPLALSYFPVATMNPYQRLLYSRAEESGFAIVPTLQMQHLGRIHWRGRSVLHLHWLASVLYGVATPGAAHARIEGLRADMAGWRAAGHRIIWTMHNVLPHDCPFPEAEIALRRVLVEGSDAIHVLSHSSIKEARQYFDLPEEKIFQVPHPSYEGWYANVDGGVSAKLDLDLPADSFTYLFFGSLQPYKGALELVDAFLRLRERNPGRKLRLVIAGKPVDAAYAAAVRDATLEHSSIQFIPSAMEERQIQVLFHAADAVVAPYRRTLNSGVAMLAASFRKPLVAPGNGGVGETFAEDPTLLYDNQPGNGPVEAMERALTHRVSSEVFDGILARHRPARVSEEFFSAVRERLFASTAARAG